MLTLRLKKGAEKAVMEGCPWVFSGQIVESSDQLLAAPGELAELRSPRNELLGVGTFNARAPIAFRLLSARKEVIDAAFFSQRLEAALQKREPNFPEAYYRLAHAESDGLPGVVIDRFGIAIVMQISTAGMEAMLPQLLDAVEEVICPETIILRNDIPARAQEGLAREVKVIKGEAPTQTEVHENRVIYLADLLKGQKTGWFYDQRENRALAATFCKGKSVVDIYSHSGGFALPAARAGATSVTLVDSSASALEMAKQAAGKNHVQCSYLQSDAFDAMQALAKDGRTFDVVLADPPAFVKSKDHIAAGIKGYEKVARMAAALTVPGGILMVASCSHHATRPRFRQAVLAGIEQAGKKAEILHFTGHAADHPVHPALPQSEYLKALFLRMA